jgi:pimeloyl-ACP methyl ester carboxylesterase
VNLVPCERRAWSAERLVGGYPVRVRSAASDVLPGRPTAVLVHGMGDTSMVWEGLLGAFGEHNVFLVDLPWSGEGGSTWPHVQEPQRWLGSALSLCPVRPDVLVGHSFGASVVLEWLTVTSPLPTSAVLIAPYFKPDLRCFEWDVLAYYVNRFQDLLAQGLRAHTRATELSDEFVTSMAEKVRERIAPAGWLEFFKLFMSSPLLPLERVRCPVSIIVGDGDISVAVDDCRALRGRLPSAELTVLERCGHHCVVEQRAATSAAVAEHLARSAGTGPGAGRRAIPLEGDRC